MEFGKLIQRIEKMATQQDKLEKAQVNLQKAQEQNNKMVLTQIKQVEETTRDDKITAMIETKIARLAEEQENRIQETRESLKKDFDTVLDQKIDRLSASVATRVRTQILDMFQQFMLPSHKDEAENIHSQKSMTMITQEGPSTPSQVASVAERLGKLSATSTIVADSPMTDVITAQHTQPQKHCSPHDINTLEQQSDE